MNMTGYDVSLFKRMKIVWIFFVLGRGGGGGGSSQNWTIGVISMHFRVLRARYRLRDSFLALLKFQIFLGALEIPDIFWG